MVFILSISILHETNAFNLLSRCRALIMCRLNEVFLVKTLNVFTDCFDCHSSLLELYVVPENSKISTRLYWTLKRCLTIAWKSLMFACWYNKMAILDYDTEASDVGRESIIDALIWITGREHSQSDRTNPRAKETFLAYTLVTKKSMSSVCSKLKIQNPRVRLK